MPRSVNADDLSEWLVGKGFGLCGCGAPDTALTVLRDYLDLLERDVREYREADDRCEVAGDGPTGQALRDERTAIQRRNWEARTAFFASWPEGAAWWWRYWCDHLGLTTHGGAVSAAWPTERGECLRQFLHKFGCDFDVWPKGEEFVMTPEGGGS